MRLRERRFIKICKAGSPFEEERVTNYVKKGVTHFFIKKEVQKIYLDYCKHLTMKILKNKSIPVHVKVAQTLNYGEQT